MLLNNFVCFKVVKNCIGCLLTELRFRFVVRINLVNKNYVIFVNDKKEKESVKINLNQSKMDKFNGRS
jgi:hypothetical protein